jgi:hypothetical protein
LTANQTEAVEATDPRAAFLLVGAGCEIDIETAARFGLPEALGHTAVSFENKAYVSPPEDKQASRLEAASSAVAYEPTEAQAADGLAAGGSQRKKRRRRDEQQ